MAKKKRTKKIKHPANFFSVFLIITVVTLALDQFSKWWARTLPWDLYVTDFLFISTITNTGVSFGMLQSMPWIPTIVAMIVIGVLLFKYNQIPKEWLFQVSCALILAGALGNLIDRMLHGAVIDFIAFTFWPTFNVADSAIVVGGILLIYGIWKREGSLSLK